MINIGHVYSKVASKAPKMFIQNQTLTKCLNLIKATQGSSWRRLWT